jgi:hypothetical protein
MLGFRQATYVGTRLASKDARRWTRLRLAIPVFVRSRDEDGSDSLEFATAINISAGGALVVVRRSIPKSATVSLEVPSVPVSLSEGLPNSSRVIRARTVWVAHKDDHHLLGLKFVRPLGTDSPSSKALRKSSTEV